MPFDLSTARPVNQASGGGFDLSTARPVQQPAPQDNGFDLESFDPAGDIAPPPAQQPIDAGLSGQVYGLVEAALAAGTGATAGTVAGVAGTLEQMAKEIISGEFGSHDAAKRIAGQSAARQAQFTRAPTTPIGQKRVQQLGETLEPLQSLPPALAEFAAIGGGIKAASPLARAAKTDITSAANNAANIVRARFADRRKNLGRSVGAAEVPKAQQRRELAEGLPVPIHLTEGQATRSFAQQRFERETAKLPDVGAPLRERFEQQNAKLQQNIDSFIDETGAISIDPRELGESVEKALRGKLHRDKARIRKLYRDAEESGAMKQRVDADSIADYLNKHRAEREENGLMVKAQRQIDALGIGDGSFTDGSLKMRDITVNEAESLRRFINKNTKQSDPNEVRISRALKNSIDKATETVGNEQYQMARRARIKLAKDFENVSLLKELTSLKKGTTDRAVALEDVLRKAVLSRTTSRDSLYSLRRVLQNSGDEGAQAWADIRGATLQHIQDEILKNVDTNQRRDRIVSAARLDKVINDLDYGGKLDVLYGKRGAEQIRVINEVAKDVLTSPPGAVNTSNTATVLAGLMDIALASGTGIPAPIVSIGNVIVKGLKDKKLKARVQKALQPAKRAK